MIGLKPKTNWALRFILGSVTIFLFLFVCLFVLKKTSIVFFVQKIVALAVFVLSSLLVQGLGLEKNFISNIQVMGEQAKFLIEITPNCLGSNEIFEAIALIAAVPNIKARKKILSLVVTIPLLFVLNILRISTTIFVLANFGIGAFYQTDSFLLKANAVIPIIVFLVFLLFVVGKKELFTTIKKAV